MMIPACWSRMLVRLPNRRNGGLISVSTTNAIRNGIRIPARPTIRAARCDSGVGRRFGADGVRAHAAVVVVVPNAALTMASSVMSGPASSATSRPARMTSDPVGQAEDLLDLVRDQQDRHAVRRQADHHVVDVALRADVDPAGRLVGDEHAGSDEQRPREEQLLLVATGQRPGRRLEQRRSGHPLEGVADLRPLGPAADEPEPLEAPEAGQADVLPDRAGAGSARRPCATPGSSRRPRRSTRPGVPARAAPATWTSPAVAGVAP